MNPILSVCLEPKQRGYRFRYLCEGSAHGPIPGETSTKENKTYPTIRIDYCPPNAVVYLHVSLCAEDSEQVHVHNLHGKSVFNGEYLEILKATERGVLIHAIQGVSILQTKNPNKNKILACKLAQTELLTDQGIIEYINLMTSWTEPNKEFNVSTFETAITNLSAYVDHAASISAANNVVRLCIRVFVDCIGKFVHLKEYSKPIYDCKTPSSSILKINRLSCVQGFMEGGDEVFLLCDKIEKDDIEVVFFAGHDARYIGNGSFSATDVFHQFVIIFKTPPCQGFNQCTVEAKLFLRRKKNPNEMSPPFDFKFVSRNSHYMQQETLLDPQFSPVSQSVGNFYPYQSGFNPPQKMFGYPNQQYVPTLSHNTNEPLMEISTSSHPSYPQNDSHFHSPHMYSNLDQQYNIAPIDNPTSNFSYSVQNVPMNACMSPHSSSNASLTPPSYQYNQQPPQSLYQHPGQSTSSRRT